MIELLTRFFRFGRRRRKLPPDEIARITVRPGGRLRITVHEAVGCQFEQCTAMHWDGNGGLRMEAPEQDGHGWLREKLPASAPVQQEGTGQ